MKIVLNGNPPSTQHIYKYRSTGKFLMGYMSKEGKDAKKRFQKEMESQWLSDVLLCDLKVSAVYFWGDKRVRDIDNYTKLWLDAGTGIIWEDDKQVKELNLKMDYDKENPRVELSININ